MAKNDEISLKKRKHASMLHETIIYLSDLIFKDEVFGSDSTAFTFGYRYESFLFLYFFMLSSCLIDF